MDYAAKRSTISVSLHLPVMKLTKIPVTLRLLLYIWFVSICPSSNPPTCLLHLFCFSVSQEISQSLTYSLFTLLNMFLIYQLFLFASSFISPNIKNFIWTGSLALCSSVLFHHNTWGLKTTQTDYIN